MSLALGQNPSYINRIENGKALPSMQGFFSICDYLKITPAEFFNDEVEQPGEIRALVEKLQKLPQEQLQLVEQITEQFLNK
ncbi:Helix-turn-helix domain [uncultured Ruminococcus sp.]|nr:Helix-turn-helix domain [uncultured Ruminococcus sp.]